MERKFTLDASIAKLTKSSKDKLQKDIESGDLPHNDIPSYMQPVLWILGYTHYFKDPENIDTVLISGNGVIGGDLSYRFPLFPGSIDKKLGFIYFDRLWRALNFGGAAAVNRLGDLKQLGRNDLLLYRGIELRLEAITFSTMPMTISFRWDYGIDRRPPIGGHKINLKIGFDFDYWDIILDPNLRMKGPKLKSF